MGRCVYTGIYEPGHPTADEDGFRTDVLNLVRELGITAVRYPGGNFVSDYRWEDGIGPRERRPVRLDSAWHTIETNEFGLDEFMRWAAKAGVETMLAVNLGTRGIHEALELWEYCNHSSGTTLSDRRIANGTQSPHGIRIWCLGNEMDGPWQVGHKTAEEYGRLAAETAKAMRRMDPDLELVACGSSNRHMPTFGAWENTVLEHTHDDVDYVSLHAYYCEGIVGDLDVDRASFLASAVDMDRFIEAVVATADAVAARRRSDKRIMLSFDEWNVWYSSRFAGPPAGWLQHPPLIEDEYTALDAVVVGSLLISLLKHCDRVRAASQAQLVNTIGLIRTDPGGSAWRQATFHPFAAVAANARGTVLQTLVDGPKMSTPLYGEVNSIDAVVCEDAGELTLFMVNRSQDAETQVLFDVSAWPGRRLISTAVLHEDDLDRTNDATSPERVTLRSLAGADLDRSTLRVPLPPVSWATVRLGS